ncbi:MAG TPA: DUF2721 domain-containing protein [Methylophilaceae bacterium]|nr:DUF2721 domain-containing protein [Methylophilaceae bacterium]HQC28267.1 DUF2721 domain-containing protein [Methylotenera sp.]
MIISSPTDIHDVSTAIRDAVAPVFLLTGIGSILSVLVNRLGRAVDRARTLNVLSTEQRKSYLEELDIIAERTTWMRWSVGLFIFAGLCVSLAIASMFIGVAINIRLSGFVLITFIAAMFSLIFGLLCFLREIILASQEVITRHRQDIKDRN